MLHIWRVVLHPLLLLCCFFFSSVSAQTSTLDMDMCKKIDQSFIASTNPRYRRLADEMGKKEAPNGRVVLCEGADRVYGEAFTVKFYGARDVVTAWGVVIAHHIVVNYTDIEMRGLMSHELAHLLSGIGFCNQTHWRSYARCEERVDKFASERVGYCSVYAMLLATKRDIEGSDISFDAMESLNYRIRVMDIGCSQANLQTTPIKIQTIHLSTKKSVH